MIGAYIASVLLAIVWVVVLIPIVRGTSFRKLWKTLRFTRENIEAQERKLYQKKGWEKRDN